MPNVVLMSVIMLSVVMPNLVLLSVLGLSVIMLHVVMLCHCDDCRSTLKGCYDGQSLFDGKLKITPCNHDK
jgi:hypothetical protein